MRAKREMDEGLRLLRRERGKAHAIMRAFESALLGTPEQRADHEADVLHEAVTDRLAQYDPPPEKPRHRRTRDYGWKKLMRGR
jgi:hypothetical protein